MSQLIAIAATLLIALASPLAMLPASANPSLSQSRSIVFFRSDRENYLRGQDQMEVRRILSRFRTSVISASDHLNFAVIESDSRVLPLLRADPRIAAIIQDFRVQVTTEEEPATSWGLDRIDQRALPLSGTFHSLSNGDGVDVYVLDTGVDADHPEFGQRVLPGVGFTGESVYGNVDPHGHGTHVAGTAAGATYGIAREATIIPVRVLNQNGSGYFSWVLAGMEWVITEAATRQRPAVANMSLGADVTYSADREQLRAITDDIIDRAAAAGVVFSLAAGNNSGNSCYFFPAFARNALTVGATAEDDTRAWYSNSGSCVDLYAPGSNIRSARTGDVPNGGGSIVFSGTSMAAPHVAGAVAIQWGAEPSLSVVALSEELKRRTVSTSSVGQLLNIQFIGCSGTPCIERAPQLSNGYVNTRTRIYPRGGLWLRSDTQRFVQWYRCDEAGFASRTVPATCLPIGSPIEPGANNSILLSADDYKKYIRVAEIAENSYGTTMHISASTSQVQSGGSTQTPLVISTLPPEVVLGVAYPVLLELSGGSGSGEISWSGTTSVCQILNAEDFPRTPTLLFIGIGTCAITATKHEDAAYATAQTTRTIIVSAPPMQAPDLVGGWQLSRVPTVGSEYEVDFPTIVGFPTPNVSEYRWWRCRTAQPVITSQKSSSGCTLIQGANQSSYRPVSADLGQRIRFGLKASSVAGVTWLQSATSPVVVGGLEFVNGPMISGRLDVGQRLSVNVGRVGGTPPTLIEYQWYSCAGPSPRGTTPHPSCTPISGAVSQRYVITTGERGRTVVVRVRATNLVGIVENFSAATGVVR